MRLREYVSLAWGSLSHNVSRAALTMLGIVIGVGSVILLNSLGAGAQGVILGAVSAIGPDSIFISAGPGDGSGPPNLATSQPLRPRDAAKLEQVQGLSAVIPIVIVNGLAAYDADDYSASVIGSVPSVMGLYSLKVTTGRFFDQGDVSGGARVAVIGSDLVDKLFPNENPLGKIIKLNKKSFQVVGTLARVGQSGFANLDGRAYVPLSAAQLYLSGNQNISAIGAIAGGVSVEEATDLIRAALRESRNLDNAAGDLARDDFRVSSQQQAAGMLNTITTAISFFLTAVAAISLIVGGIGIMNIMLVAVTERTREIGLRKAVGAPPRAIMFQFLAESTMLCTVGGAIGVTGGLSLAWLFAAVAGKFVPEWQFVTSWQSVVLALGVSAAVGIAFGTYPARAASKLEPVETLRYE